MYLIRYTKQAEKDLEKIKKIPYKEKVILLLNLIQKNPYTEPPLFEPLVGCKKYSRRINIQHRLVYQVYEDEKYIEILSCWTHYHE